MPTIKPTENKTGFIFFLFCIWSFFLLCRPQDLFPALGQFRPVLLTGIFTLSFFVLYFKNLSGPPLFQEPQIKYFSALVIVMVLGIPFSLYAGFSFEIIFKNYINVILFVFIFYLIVCSVERLYKVVLLGCLGSGLYMAYGLVYQSSVSDRFSYGGVFDPNDIAFFALAFLPLNLVFISRDNSFFIRSACIANLIIGLIVILKSGSRGGFLALGVVAVLLLLLETVTIRFAFKTGFVIILSSIIIFSTIDFDRYKTLLTIEDDYNLEDETGRIEIWKIGIRALIANPITGVGVGNFAYAVGLDRESRDLPSTRWQAPHNSIIQIATETGVLGLALFVYLNVNAFRIFSRAKKAYHPKLAKIGEMGLVGFTGMFISGLFLSQGYSVYFAFYFAVSAVMNQLLWKETTMSLGSK